MRPGGRFLVVHEGLHRESDEQRRLVGVVVGQLDPDRQPLDDLDEVAGGILRRQQRKRLTGPHGEPGDPALELLVAAVHVHLARTRWPIRKSRSCVSLKLASIQISVSERTAIRLCPAGRCCRDSRSAVTTPSISAYTLQ